MSESTAIRFFIYGLQSKIKDALWSFGPTTLSSAINYAYLQEQWQQQESNEKDEDECRHNLPEQETDSYENLLAEEKHERIEEESSEILDLTVAVAVAETEEVSSLKVEESSEILDLTVVVAVAETEEVSSLKVEEASEILDLTVAGAVAVAVAEIEEINYLKVEEDASYWKSSKNDGVATVVIQIDEIVAEEEKHGYGKEKLIAQSSMLARCLTRNFATIQALYKNAPPFLFVRTSHTTSLISSPSAARTSNLGALMFSSVLDPRFSALFHPFVVTKKGRCGNRISSKFEEVPCDAHNVAPIGTFFGDNDSSFHVYHSVRGGTGFDTRILVISKEREEHFNSMLLTSFVSSYSLLSPILLVKGRECVGQPRQIPLHSLEWGAPVINQRSSGHKDKSETMISGGSCERLNKNDVDFTLRLGRGNNADESGEIFQWVIGFGSLSVLLEFSSAENGCGDDVQMWVDRISSLDTYTGLVDIGLGTAKLSQVCSRNFLRNSQQISSGPLRHDPTIPLSFANEYGRESMDWLHNCGLPTYWLVVTNLRGSVTGDFGSGEIRQQAWILLTIHVVFN